MYKILDKIQEHFKEKYVITKNKLQPNTIQIKLKYEFELTIGEFVRYDNENMVKLTFYCGIYSHEITCNSLDEDYYLNEVDKIIKDLLEQIELYEEFIEGFTDYVDGFITNYMINLNTGYAYIKGDNIVVIYPVIEFNHKEKYVTMKINTLNGQYPMKMYSSISFEDAWDMVSFFL